MTDQEAFDTVVQHLLKQNKRSMRIQDLGGGTSKEFCMYRGPGGLTCAIGCLIPDEEYQEDFDNGAWDTRDVIARVPALRGISAELLCDLQNCHDVYPPAEWKTQLGIVAREYGLESDLQ